MGYYQPFGKLSGFAALGNIVLVYYLFTNRFKLSLLDD